MPKSDHERAEIRRKTEEARQPGKDRSAHEALRGGQIPTLSDLSKEWPTRDQVFNFGVFVDLYANDRAGIIMASALVEQALYMLVCSHLIDLGEDTRKGWFENPGAPFSTFAAKIKLGRALGIYKEQTEGSLNVIKNVRNVFAHRALPLDFSHPSIEIEVFKLKPADGKETAKSLFYHTCAELVGWFTRVTEEQAGKVIHAKLP